MKLFPESALQQLEFDKIKALLEAHARTEYGKEKSRDLRVHTRLSYIDLELRQTHEQQQLMVNGIYFPADFTANLAKELKLLSIPGATLSGEHFLQIRKLADHMHQLFRWFDAERRETYPALSVILEGCYYEKHIIQWIDEVIDETGQVKDSASEDLRNIRMNLFRRRNELRKVFERIVQKLNKQGYLADIEESFLNGRRVLAVFAEQKRMVKGVLHGESESRRTTFIEPEETMELNNQVFSLEHEESREVSRILRQLTSRLQVHASLLQQYLTIMGEYDFTRAKARLAQDMQANYPMVVDKACIHLVQAYHPLLYLYNQRAQKPTIPTQVTLDEKNRILVISGPNAGGKTVTMKTVGLLQLMVQSGLLVPVHPNSQMGVFKQLMIHIGDTQSIEFELSTYSSHLQNMKHFMEAANGKTLFFIDELGSGSDPNLGGAFAEVILEELGKKHAMGIVTTHYLNLKVMANKTPGILNGAMAFDEKSLLPLYKLILGKPGSSYTFSIAERIGLEKRLIQRARTMVDEAHFSLDKLLNRTEQDLRDVEKKEKQLNTLLKENERLKSEMEHLLKKEKHKQQMELLKEQNRVAEEKFVYLKDMERKIKQILMDWKKSDNKEQVMKEMFALLFKKNEVKIQSKMQKKVDARYQEVQGSIAIGSRVKMRKNHQVGEVLEIRGKRAIVKIGLLPMQVDLQDLVMVTEKPETESK